MTDRELTDEQFTHLLNKTLRHLKRLFMQHKADPPAGAAILQLALYRLVKAFYFDADGHAAALHIAEEFKRMAADLAPPDKTVN